MIKNKLPIIWNDEVVGEIINFTSDGFDIYGKWKPSNNEKVLEFIEEIKSKGEALVQVGDSKPELLGTVEFIPDEEIEIKQRPNLSK
jgi:hypothetical protein